MYETVYNLKERAFEPAPAARFHFPSLSHRRAMSAIGFGLNRGAGIIAIFGELGTGRTQLVAHVLSQIDRDRAALAMLSLSGREDRSLADNAAAAFGVQTGHDSANAREALADHLIAEREEGRAALLVIDDAHHLDEEGAGDLAALAGVTHDQRGLLQILLTADETFQQRLEGDSQWQAVRGRVVADHRLEPLLRDEIDPYIYHRLSVAGRAGRPEIDPGLASLVYEATGGVPSLVNATMTLLLERAAEAGEELVSGDALAAVLDETDFAPMEELPSDRAEEQQPVDADPEPRHHRETDPPLKTHAEPRPAPDPVPRDDNRMAALSATLAEAELRLTELGREVADLRDRNTADAQATDETRTALTERLDRLEARIDEQDRALKHVLSRLIRFFEGSADEADREP